MGYFESVKVYTFMTKICYACGIGQVFPKLPKKCKDVTVELYCHVLFQAPVSFEISGFFIFGPIWLKFS